MNVEIIKCLEDNYSYLIIDSKKNACVVDPSEEEPVIASVESNQANLKYILNTHHHFDHIGGNLNLKEKYNAKEIGYVKDKPDKKYAIKKIYRKSDIKYVKYLNLEIEIMAKLNHKNIKKLYDTIYTDKHVFLVLELLVFF